MSISSVNPATGQVLKKFEPHSEAEVERRVALAHHTFSTWRRTSWRERSERLSAAGADPRQPQGRVGPADDARDGQDHRLGGGRSREVRLGLSLLRRERRALPRRRTGAHGCQPKLRPLRPPRPGPRRHALELSVLAGFPFCGPGAGGGERGAAQARLERSRLRARDRGDLPRGRVSRRSVPDAPRRLRPRREAHRGSPDRRRHADRKRRCGSLGRTDRGRPDQEVRAGARRERPVRRHAERRPRGRCLDRGQGPHDQQRPVLHRGQALHRPSRRSPTPSRSDSSKRWRL